MCIISKMAISVTGPFLKPWLNDKQLQWSMLLVTLSISICGLMKKYKWILGHILYVYSMSDEWHVLYIRCSGTNSAGCEGLHLIKASLVSTSSVKIFLVFDQKMKGNATKMSNNMHFCFEMLKENDEEVVWS